MEEGRNSVQGVHSAMPMTQSNATSFIVLVKLGWNWLTKGELKERSMMPTETTSTGILNFLKSTLHPSSMP